LPPSDTLRGWFDFHDAATLFQDAAATTAVAAPGDPIGYVANKAADGPPLSIGPTSFRPAWQAFGDGRRGALFDGADDVLLADDAAYWSFLHDGRGAAIFVSIAIAGTFDGALLYNAAGLLGLTISCGRAGGGAAYVQAQVSSGFDDMPDPAWFAETASDASILAVGRNVVGVGLARSGETNTTSIRTNGVLRAEDSRDVAIVNDAEAGALYLQPSSAAWATIGQVLIYETPAMFDHAEEIEAFLM
jgi:hypothetical protein